VEWVNKAERKKKSFQFFSNSRYEEAAEMYERAGQCFKLSKNCTSAVCLFLVYFFGFGSLLIATTHPHPRHIRTHRDRGWPCFLRCL
jgi:hypothetical protein